MWLVTPLQCINGDIAATNPPAFPRASQSSRPRQTGAASNPRGRLLAWGRPEPSQSARYAGQFLRQAAIQDCVLQTLEFVAGLDAQFLYHHSAGKVVYLERFRL